MQRRKSKRHQIAARARWRAAEALAEAERDSGIHDREPAQDFRQPFDLLLRSAGYKDLRIEPRIGYVAWRAVDVDTGDVVDCAALKTLLRNVAERLPRMLGARNLM